MGGPGQGAGGRAPVGMAPAGFKSEFSQSADDDKGKVLAQTFVKAGQVTGESKAGLRDAVRATAQQSADEVDRQRVSRQGQSAVRDYFQAMQAAEQPTAPPPANKP